MAVRVSVSLKMGSEHSAEEPWRAGAAAWSVSVLTGRAVPVSSGLVPILEPAGQAYPSPHSP